MTYDAVVNDAAIRIGAIIGTVIGGLAAFIGSVWLWLLLIVIEVIYCGVLTLRDHKRYDAMCQPKSNNVSGKKSL